MEQAFSRTELLLGPDALRKLAGCRVAIFGVGGVGGFVVEALARAGIGALDLVDNDVVCRSNFNRQILATEKTLGRYKVDAAAERIADINPACRVRTFRSFFLPETAGQFDFSVYDYVADAIDTVCGKIQLALSAREAGTPLISAMGTGNKLDPSLFRAGDLFETENCPLARVMRKELRKRGVESLKVVWSPEMPLTPAEAPENRDGSGKAEEGGRQKPVPGSVSFVPPVAGMIMAGEIVRDLIRTEK